MARWPYKSARGRRAGRLSLGRGFCHGWGGGGRLSGGPQAPRGCTRGSGLPAAGGGKCEPARRLSRTRADAPPRPASAQSPPALSALGRLLPFSPPGSFRCWGPGGGVGAPGGPGGARPGGSLDRSAGSPAGFRGAPPAGVTAPGARACPIFRVSHQVHGEPGFASRLLSVVPFLPGGCLRPAGLVWQPCPPLCTPMASAGPGGPGLGSSAPRHPAAQSPPGFLEGESAPHSGFCAHGLKPEREKADVTRL